ncbi:hypothetical protein VF14_00610 [Nostoc linckia z18]|uniref:Lipoprotein n=2 Tax=Nostoc linckia TaxID=92942 RepID=A0A9Q5ZAZ0_NOSLI|nr:hypothetical protein [Nostoc linckia]PHK43177.1 hypothetical protein VF12_00610 [Nostoc linckia z15]PHK48447.1 hypothetical protein VF13_00605 [Nostoc linckia z16]PHJ67356.1 hypothetical protein VF02_06270 [Nostoc linckia z1]PHJ71158.1 hypothetical protein VF05_08625 [Nostoc linckia z3]PHJ76597.1 hypothetical protein VF03_07480 [Nostoc linckia z2]
MQSFKLGFVVFASVGLLFLGACSNQASESSSNPSSPSTENTNKTEPAAKTETSAHGDSHGKNAQVVEAGKYHLEFVPEKEGNATHLDFYLQTGEKHEAVPNAKVTADVQSPDGKQKTVPLTYDADGKHYTAKLDGGAAGQYQVKVIADVGTEKVNGRFSFNQ